MDDVVEDVMSEITPDLRRTRTLIVEEDPRIRQVLHRTLKQWNAVVSEAENGARGVVALKHARDERRPFELILVSSRMRGMDGFELCELLQAHPEELARTILLIGPNHRGSDILRTGKVGVAGYVTKPLSGAELYRAIAEIVQPREGDPALPDAPPPEPPPEGRIRVLLVEDSPDTRAMIQYFLDDPEYQIDLAENGSIAVDLYRLGSYDIILMDLQMPVFDGYAATREIRDWEKRNDGARVPVIAFTAHVKTEDRQKTLRAGFDGYLEKPVDKKTLRTTIDRFVKREVPPGLHTSLG